MTDRTAADHFWSMPCRSVTYIANGLPVCHAHPHQAAQVKRGPWASFHSPVARIPRGRHGGGGGPHLCFRSESPRGYVWLSSESCRAVSPIRLADVPGNRKGSQAMLLTDDLCGEHISIRILALGQAGEHALRTIASCLASVRSADNCARARADASRRPPRQPLGIAPAPARRETARAEAQARLPRLHWRIRPIFVRADKRGHLHRIARAHAGAGKRTSHPPPNSPAPSTSCVARTCRNVDMAGASSTRSPASRRLGGFRAARQSTRASSILAPYNGRSPIVPKGPPRPKKRSCSSCSTCRQSAVEPRFPDSR